MEKTPKRAIWSVQHLGNNQKNLSHWVFLVFIFSGCSGFDTGYMVSCLLQSWWVSAFCTGGAFQTPHTSCLQVGYRDDSVSSFFCITVAANFQSGVLVICQLRSYRAWHHKDNLGLAQTNEQYLFLLIQLSVLDGFPSLACVSLQGS